MLIITIHQPVRLWLSILTQIRCRRMQRCWDGGAAGLQVGYVYDYYPNNEYNYHGFRLCRTGDFLGFLC